MMRKKTCSHFLRNTQIAFKPKFLASRVEKERRAVLSELQMMNTIEYRVDCQVLLLSLLLLFPESIMVLSREIKLIFRTIVFMSDRFTYLWTIAASSAFAFRKHVGLSLSNRLGRANKEVGS